MFFINLYYDLMYGKIVAAALRKGNKVYIGRKHSDCFIQENKGVLRNAEQGFYTRQGKFVNRKIALRIAKHYNQVKYKHRPTNELLSEDLI